MKKKTEHIFRFLSMATVITIVSLDFFQIYDFGIDRLIYKVNPLFADLITIIPSLEEFGMELDQDCFGKYLFGCFS